jgi:macrodomain Ter protein organizer (MatP/YcbG family)
MSYVLENIDKPWDWKYLSGNPNIKMSDVLENINKPWNWKYLSMNRKV